MAVDTEAVVVIVVADIVAEAKVEVEVGKFAEVEGGKFEKVVMRIARFVEFG